MKFAAFQRPSNFGPGRSFSVVVCRHRHTKSLVKTTPEPKPIPVCALAEYRSFEYGSCATFCYPEFDLVYVG